MKRFEVPLLVGLLGVLAGGGVYAFLLQYSVALKTEIATMEEKIKEAEKYRQEIPRLEEELRLLQQEVEVAQAKTFPELMPDKVLAVARAAEGASGASLLLLRETGYEGEGAFGVARYTLEVQGRYPALRAFLRELSQWSVAWRLLSLEMGVDGPSLKGQLSLEVPVLRREALPKAGVNP